jgi:type 1 fimbria pilin
VREAEYIAMRRFTASDDSSTTTVGVLSSSSCSAVNCAAPAKVVMVKNMVSKIDNPASVATTPSNSANGVTTRINGAPWRTPVQ